MNKAVNHDVEYIKKRYVEDRVSSDEIGCEIGYTGRHIRKILKENNIKRERLKQQPYEK